MIDRPKLDAIFRDLLGGEEEARKSAASDLKFATNGQWSIEGVDDVTPYAEALSAMLSSPDADVRTLASTAIAAAAVHGIDVTHLLSSLEKAVTDRTKAVRHGALRALTALELAKGATESLTKRYDEARGSGARGAIFAALGQLAVRGADVSGALDLLVRGLGSGDRELAKRARNVLTAWFEASDVSASERRRRAGETVRLLSSAPGARGATWEEMLTLARSRFDDLDPARIPAARERLSHEDAREREEAGRELARLATRGLDIEGAVPALEVALADSNGAMCAAAAGALFEHRVARREFSATLELLDHPEASVRAETLRRVWLALATHVDVGPIMHRVQLMVADPDPEVRENATRAVFGGALAGAMSAADVAGTAALAESVGGAGEGPSFENAEKVAILMAAGPKTPSTDARSESMARIYAICEKLIVRVGQLTVMHFAEERGWSSEDAAKLEGELSPLEDEARELWAALATNEPSAVERYDARVRLAVELLRKANDAIDGFRRKDVEERALPTASPERKFDYWAIWAVHQLTPPRREAL